MTQRIAIIGAGPAGLMAAEVLSQFDYDIHVYEQKPSAARKFLMAGKKAMIPPSINSQIRAGVAK